MTKPACMMIKSLYQAINRRDISAAIDCIDDECIYEDLNFPQPFRGKAAVQQLFEESFRGVPDDLLFVIDDITTGDPSSTGVLWHVELDGIPFPNGRGVSFYRLSETTGKLVFARDVVEPPIKPGKVAFWIIRLVTPLVRRLLKRQPETSATAKSEQPQPWVAIALALVAILYTYVLLLSPPNQLLPGEPIWAIQPETLQEILDESLNFFLILPILNGVGIHVMESPTVHPTLEALFNFAEAWIFMFLPLLLMDKRGRHLPKVLMWSVAMFLTNVMLTPYMALRYTVPRPQEKDEPEKSWLARLFGWIGLIVGTLAIVWGFVGRPEFGDLAQRAQYFRELLMSNRVTIAFCVDLVLFSIFQGVLLTAVVPSNKRKRWLRYVPFWGLAVWLII